jgi:hypothetical protein
LVTIERAGGPAGCRRQLSQLRTCRRLDLDRDGPGTVIGNLFDRPSAWPAYPHRVTAADRSRSISKPRLGFASSPLDRRGMKMVPASRAGGRRRAKWFRANGGDHHDAFRGWPKRLADLAVRLASATADEIPTLAAARGRRRRDVQDPSRGPFGAARRGRAASRCWKIPRAASQGALSRTATGGRRNVHPVRAGEWKASQAQRVLGGSPSSTIPSRRPRTTSRPRTPDTQSLCR